MNIEALFLSHHQELIGKLYRIVRCMETASDLVQESYLVLTRESTKQPIRHPRGFLFRVATNLAYDYLKHGKVRERHVLHEEARLSALADEPTVERIVANEQRLQLLEASIAQLPPRCREVFVLHKLYGLSYREIAAKLSISESAVEKHMIKALSHCRRASKHANAGLAG